MAGLKYAQLFRNTRKELLVKKPKKAEYKTAQEAVEIEMKQYLNFLLNACETPEMAGFFLKQTERYWKENSANK